MFILRFFHFLLGYVELCARGGFPERFINLCSKENVPVRELRYRGGELTGKTGISGYKAMRHIARRSGMKICIKRRAGLPFFLHRYRRRAGLLVGFALFLGLTLLLSTMIWSVEVEGNSLIPDDEIIAVFDRLGVRAGVRSSRLDAAAIESEALKSLEQLSWLSLNLDGSKAVIEVRERVNAPPLVNRNGSCNVVAKAEGQIVVMETFNGEPQVKVGAAVAKGDLLISGITENLDLTVAFRSADGYVIARTEKKFETDCRSTVVARLYTSQKSRPTIGFLGLKFPILPLSDGEKGAEYYESEKHITVSGTRLPLWLGTRRSTSYETVPLTIESDCLRLFAAAELLHKTALGLKHCEVESEKVYICETKEGFYACGDYVCRENIGEISPFEVEESGTEQ